MGGRSPSNSLFPKGILKHMKYFVFFLVYGLVLIFLFGLYYKHLHSEGTDFPNFDDPVDPYYYSFITMFTVGYGDFAPISRTGKIVTCLQVLLFWSSILLFNLLRVL